MAESRTDYQVVRDHLLEFYDQYFDLAKLMFSEKEVDQLRITVDARKKQIVDKEFTLVVIGEMKHGKSTFLNALLRKPAFPKDVREATAAVTFMKHNDRISATHPEWQNKAVVEFYDKPLAVVDHLELEKYTTCLHQGELNVAEDVKSVTIYTDSQFVEDGVIVVDTPGTNTTNAKHEQITYSQIDRSNAAVFLFKAGEAGKASDYSFLVDTSKKIDKFFFVVNRIDEVGGIEEAGRIIEDIQRKVSDRPELSRLFASKEFYPTSGLLALLARYPEYIPNEKFKKDVWDAFYQDDPAKKAELLKESGMEKFENDLLDFLFKGERTREFLNSHFTFLENKISDAKHSLQDRLNVLNSSTKLKDLEQQKAILDAEMEKQKSKMASASDDLISRLQSTLKDFIESSNTEINTILDRFQMDLDSILSAKVLETQWPELNNQVNHIISRFMAKNQFDLKGQIQDVFRSADSRLRGELNKSLSAANILAFPEAQAIEIGIQRPEMVFQEQEDLKKAEKEIAGLNAEISKLNEQADEFAANEKKLADLENKRDQVKEDALRKNQMLGKCPEARRIVDSPECDREVKRGGLLGGLMNILFGPKQVHCAEEYHYDNSPIKKYEEDKEKLQKWEKTQLAKIEAEIEKHSSNLTEQEKSVKRLKYKRQLQEESLKHKRELKRILDQKTADAEAQSVVSNKLRLKNNLDQALREYCGELEKLVSNCTMWADSYIADIQFALNESMDSKRAELAELEALLGAEKSKKAEALRQIQSAEQACSQLSSDFDDLKKQAALLKQVTE